MTSVPDSGAQFTWGDYISWRERAKAAERDLAEARELARTHQERAERLEDVLDGVLDAAVWLTGLAPIDPAEASAWPEMREKINRGLDARRAALVVGDKETAA